MGKKFILKLSAFLLINMISFSNNPETINQSLESIHRQLQRVKRNYSNLMLSGQLRFETPVAQALYYRSLQNLDDQIAELEAIIGGGDSGYENFRGRAVAAIQKSVSSAYQSAAVKSLPAFVSEGDLAAVEFIVNNVSVVHLANILKAYFNQSLNQPKIGNQKHSAAILIMTEVSRIFHIECLNALPGYISSDDQAAVRAIVENNPSPRVANALQDYFQTN